MGDALDRGLTRVAEVAGGLLGARRGGRRPSVDPQPAPGDLRLSGGSAAADVAAPPPRPAPAPKQREHLAERAPVVATLRPLRPAAPRFRPAPAPLGRPALPTGAPAATAPAWPPHPRPRPAQPPARGRRTAGRVAARTHVLVGTVVGLLLVSGLAAFWLIEVHQRIGEATLVHGIQTRDHPQSVRCIPVKGNGSVWACGVAFHAESVCYLANVSVFGSWNTAVANHKCDRLSALGGIPPAPTAQGIALDLQRQAGGAVAACAKAEGYHNRWLCVERGSGGLACVFVRVVPWVPFATNAARPQACRKNPHLRVVYAGA